MDSSDMYGKLWKIKNIAKDIQLLVELGVVTTQRRDRLYSPIKVPETLHKQAETIYDTVAAMKLETLHLITRLEADYQNPEHPKDAKPPKNESKGESTPERGGEE
jgi:hypothetical protein